MPKAIKPRRRQERRVVVVASQWGLLEPVAKAVWVVVEVGAGSLMADQSSSGLS